MKSKSTQRKSLRGTATVELAVCLPMMVLLLFASIEGANMLFLRQAVVQSAYETAKAVARRNGNQTIAVELGNQVLSSRNIVAPTIVFDPSNVQSLSPGELFSVTVSVPGDSRSITKIGPFKGLIIRAQAAMVKE